MDNVAIGIPVSPDYQADVRTITMVESWTKEDGIDSICVPSPSPEEGRDKIVSIVNYMRPRPTHILFLDSDVIPRTKTLKVLLGHGKDIISGVVPIFQRKNFAWNVSREEDFSPLEEDDLPSNPFKVESCGFGIVLVKTSVLDKMEWPYWRSEYKPGLRTLGEDIYFCQKAKAAGFDIWCDPKVKCDHVTRSSYLSMLRSKKGTQ